eukprot:6480861-Amphidinium_carterae.1
MARCKSSSGAVARQTILGPPASRLKASHDCPLMTCSVVETRSNRPLPRTWKSPGSMQNYAKTQRTYSLCDGKDREGVRNFQVMQRAKLVIVSGVALPD